MLSTLRRLTLTIVVFGSPADNPQLHWLVRNLQDTERRITSALETLVIRLTVLMRQPAAESISNTTIWTDLDAALTAPRYSNLCKFSCYVSVRGPNLIQDTSLQAELTVQLAQKMPLLHDRHVLSLFV